MQHASGMPWTLPLGLLRACSYRRARRSRSCRAFRRAARKCRDTPDDRAHRDGMIAAQHQRKLAVGQRVRPPSPPACVQVAAICGRYLASRIAFAGWLSRWITGTLPRSSTSIAQLRQPRVQIRHAHRRRPHVHAAPSRAEVERRADDRDVRCRPLHGRLHRLARATT